MVQESIVNSVKNLNEYFTPYLNNRILLKSLI